MESPFLSYKPEWFTEPTPEYIENMAKLNLRKKIERQIYTPYYRLDQWKSVPLTSQKDTKQKHPIIYDNQAGCLMVAKKRLVHVTFSNNVTCLTFDQVNCIDPSLATTVSIKG